MIFADLIARKLHLNVLSVQAVFRLLDEDHTVPFIARYRKEATGQLDEVALFAVRTKGSGCKNWRSGAPRSWKAFGSTVIGHPTGNNSFSI